MDPLAMNYDSYATVDDGSCMYCVYGCTDPLASNFDPLATCDDGTCGSPTVYGCINPNALNYDPNGTFDNGSCNFIKTYVPDDVFEAWLEGNGYGDGIALASPISMKPLEAVLIPDE